MGDEDYMRIAITAARFGLGEVSPNPAVGCVIVKEAQILAIARTAKGGRPHAETQALAQAGSQAEGATAYVSLEPCAHHGKTPPCAEALIEARVKRVVIGAADPDPRVGGKGVAMLEAAGIDVTQNCLAEDCAALNQGFLLGVLENRPLVTLKIATSADGFMSTGDPDNPWITGELARRWGHLLRAMHEAIVIGGGTLRADNPRLDCRLSGLSARQPVPYIITKQSIAADAHLAAHAICDQGDDLDGFLQSLHAQGMTRVLVEGGATLARSFLEQGLVDEIFWFQAPHRLHRSGKSDLQKMGIADLSKISEFEHQETRQCGVDRLTIWRKKR